jgi:hypothetical protein
MLSFLIMVTEVGLHFGFAVGIVHVALLIHDGHLSEALIRTVIICACILFFAVTMYVARKLLGLLDK